MPVTALAAACGASFIISFVMCAWLRKAALRRSLVDVPNDRSLHRVPVPRLGGVGLSIGLWSGVLIAMLSTEGPVADVWVWLAASFVVAAVGLIDDVKPLGAGPRLAFQFAVALAVVYALGTPPTVTLAGGVRLVVPSLPVAAVEVVWMVAVLNICNFMDGMDGLAASQSVAAGLSVSVALTVHHRGALAFISLAMVAACAGFFIHNSSPARLFMGDSGSTLLGFSFGMLAIAANRGDDPLPILVVPIALSPFLLDGTFTLLRRALRGEAIWKAHRTHLYQRAVTTGLDHRDVLGPYAIWMAGAGVLAIVASRASGREMVGLALTSLAGLVAMWTWVVRLERQRGSNPEGIHSSSHAPSSDGR